MRIRIENLQSHIAATMAAIKAGVEDARANGLQAELPEEVAFTVDVIREVQVLSSVETTVTAGTDATTANKPVIVETTLESGGGSTTHEVGSQTTSGSDHTVGLTNDTENGTQAGTDRETTSGGRTESTTGSNTKTSTDTATTQNVSVQIVDVTNQENSTTEKGYH